MAPPSYNKKNGTGPTKAVNMAPKGTSAPGDVIVPQPGNDGITSLVWSPRPLTSTSTTEMLISSNWDGKVRCWKIQTQEGTGACTAIPFTFATHDAGVLDCCLSSAGDTIFSGGCDNFVRMWRLDGKMQSNDSNLALELGNHNAPIKAVKHLQGSNLVVSGGWDKKLKLWDVRRPRVPVGVENLPERVYSLDVSVTGNFMVVATASRHIIEYDVGGAKLPQEMSRSLSPSDFETRIVKTIPTNSGTGKFGKHLFNYVVGSVDGYVYFVPMKRNWLSSAHEIARFSPRKDKVNRFSVNAVAFHRPTGSMVTGLANGELKFWDVQKAKAIKHAQMLDNAVACAEFNSSGGLLAYASSYDWSKGVAHYSPGAANEIFIQKTPDTVMMAS